MTLAQLEANLHAKQAEAKTLIETVARACEDHVVEPAKDGKPAVTGRLKTPEEKAQIQALLDEAKAIQARIDDKKNDTAMLDKLGQMTAGMTPGGGGAPGLPKLPGRGFKKSLGQLFIDSDTFAWIKQTSNTRGSMGWTAPSSELPFTPAMWAATLTEGSSSGGDLVIEDTRPGIIEYLQRRVVVADLIAPGTTDSNSVGFMRELAPTNAAATVAEGAAKPESTLVFEAASAPVRKIATWLPVSDEMLEDVPAIRSFIDQRLRMFVQLAEDDQLLNGDGNAPNILGIRNQTGLQTDVTLATGDNNADPILRQISAIGTNALIDADGIVMHPSDWLTIQQMKTDAGEYIGSGPFDAPQVPRLWGLPVAQTPAMTDGTALVGAFRTGAQFFRRGGLRVDASNSHSDYFVKNLTAIRAEERGALAVYRPGAFGEVTGLL